MAIDRNEQWTEEAKMLLEKAEWHKLLAKACKVAAEYSQHPTPSRRFRLIAVCSEGRNLCLYRCYGPEKFKADLPLLVQTLLAKAEAAEGRNR